MAIKTFTTGEVLTASDTNTYLANCGLVYVAGSTFAGVTAFDITGFSSTFTGYRVIIQTRRVDTVGMGTMNVNLRNNTTNITTGYYEGAGYATYLSGTGAAFARNNGSNWVWGNSDSAAATGNWSFDMYALTGGGLTFNGIGFSVGEATTYFIGGSNGTTSAYDRLRVAYDYGTHTGRWILQGYRTA